MCGPALVVRLVALWLPGRGCQMYPKESDDRSACASLSGEFWPSHAPQGTAWGASCSPNLLMFLFALQSASWLEGDVLCQPGLAFWGPFFSSSANHS
jgi:hypothetical protein